MAVINSRLLTGTFMYGKVFGAQLPSIGYRLSKSSVPYQPYSNSAFKRIDNFCLKPFCSTTPCWYSIMHTTDSVVPEGASVQTIKDEAAPEGEIKPESQPEPAAAQESTSVTGRGDVKKERVRKRKIVFLLSYCGQAYYGMQMNPFTKTIEEEFFKSLLKNDYVDEAGYKKPQLYQFQRAARTDKHVSAARQIVSMKIDENVDIHKINEHLPPEIRVMATKRVTKNFDSKNNCDARTYMYMTPSFAFAPLEVPCTEDYRITPEVLEQVRETLKVYLGTKNFHNFTSRKRPNDPSAIRIIKSFTCSDPFVKDGLEYVILRVKGQSFMMHQIRKMIGLVMAYVRGFASKDVFEKCWTADRIDIPRAPGVGLMLDYVHYERYDQKFGCDGMHDPITWDSVEDKVLKFCDEHIYPVVTRCENEDKSMLNWLQTLPFHTYDVRDPTDNTDRTQSSIGKAYYRVLKDRGLDTGLNPDGSDDEESEDERDQIRAKKAKLAAE